MIILGLSLKAWIAIVTLVGVIVVMMKSHIPSEVAFLGAVTVLLVAGVVSEEEAMSGFGSEPVVVHAAFFVIIAGLRIVNVNGKNKSFHIYEKIFSIIYTVVQYI